MLAIVLLFIASTSRADSNEGIIVSGSGKASSKPTSVEIPCMVTGDAELTADAIVKYRDARKRGIAALEGLKIAGLTVDSKGYAVKDFQDNSAAAQQAMMRGQVMPNTKQKVSVVEQLQIVIKDADKMDQSQLMDTILKVLDTTRDSGLTLGDGTPRQVNYYPPPPPPALVNFKVTDTTALREQAYKAAMDDAKAHAQKLADLAGVKLGRILSVHDGGPKNNSNNDENSPYVIARQTQQQNELNSTVFDDIPLNVNLTVQFEIEK